MFILSSRWTIFSLIIMHQMSHPTYEDVELSKWVNIILMNSNFVPRETAAQNLSIEALISAGSHDQSTLWEQEIPRLLLLDERVLLRVMVVDDIGNMLGSPAILLTISMLEMTKIIKIYKSC